MFFMSPFHKMVKKIPREVIRELKYRLNLENEISQSNWEEFRNEEANRQYPVGTDIQCGQSWAREPDYNNFFRVKKITPTGVLVTDKLILEEVANDCDQSGGWIDYNPKSAEISGTEVRFFPSLREDRYLVKLDKKGNLRKAKWGDMSAEWDSVCYIDWCGTRRSGYHYIMKLEPGKNGLVRAVMGGLL
jgi:hypothetical protein